ncbi:MAG: PKD domain-containing protein [Bacteroidales bacterium]|nr:PKD domain-containing protein [Bacteroidales bacterium]
METLKINISFIFILSLFLINKGISQNWPATVNEVCGSFGTNENASFHNGIDIAGTAWTNVIAIGNGEITQVNQQNNSVNIYIELDVNNDNLANDGVFAVYVHCEELPTTDPNWVDIWNGSYGLGFTPVIGTKVTQGQVFACIAPSGSGGAGTTFDHVHFSYQEGTNPLADRVNPLDQTVAFPIGNEDPPGTGVPPHFGPLFIKQPYNYDSYQDYTLQPDLFGCVKIIRDISDYMGHEEPNPSGNVTLTDPDAWDLNPPNTSRIQGITSSPYIVEFSVEDENGNQVFPIDNSGTVYEAYTVNSFPILSFYLLFDVDKPSPATVSLEYFYCYDLTNITSDDNNITITPEDKYWNTCLKDGEGWNGNTASLNSEAEFSDGLYTIKMSTEDLVNSPVEEEIEMIIDNFVPFVERVEVLSNNIEIYEAHWDLGVSDLTLSSPDGDPDNSIVSPASPYIDVVIKIYSSEPMTEVNITDISPLDWHPTSPTSVSADNKVWTFTIPNSQIPNDGSKDGIQIISIEGRDYADNEIQAYNDSKTSYRLYEIPKRDLTAGATYGNWSPSKNDGADQIHRFEIQRTVITTGFKYEQKDKDYPNLVSFTDLSTPSEEIYTRSWNFGDGNTSPDPNNPEPEHLYDDPGEYHVSLTVNGYYTWSEDIKVLRTDEIQCNFDYDIIPDDDYYYVNFNDKSKGLFLEYLWTFSGGDPSSSLVQNPRQIQFDNNNSLNPVTLSLTNYYLYSSTCSQTISYNPATDPTLILNMCQISGTYEVSFWLAVNNAETYDYTLEFGDGASTGLVTGQTTMSEEFHSYYSAGTYTVKVTYTAHNAGNTITKERYADLVVSSSQLTVITSAMGTGSCPGYQVGEQINFSATVTGGDGSPYFYTWVVYSSSSGEYLGSKQGYSATIPAYAYTFLEAGDYFVDLFVSNRGITGRSITSVSIVEPVQCIEAGIDEVTSGQIIDVCIGSSAIFNAYYTYGNCSWMPPEELIPNQIAWYLDDDPDPISSKPITDGIPSGEDLEAYIYFETDLGVGLHTLRMDMWNDKSHDNECYSFFRSDEVILNFRDDMLSFVITPPYNERVGYNEIRNKNEWYPRTYPTGYLQATGRYEDAHCILSTDDPWIRIEDTEMDAWPERERGMYFGYEENTTNAGRIGSVDIHCTNCDYNADQTFYFYQMSAAGAPIQTVNAGVDGNNSDFLGYSVAVDGNYAIAGAPGDNHTILLPDNRGSAYIFKKNDIGEWEKIKRVRWLSSNNDDNFGTSVDIDGDYAVVGAVGANGNVGAGYVLYKYEGGTDEWGIIAKLAPNTTDKGRAGQSIAISGNTVVIGAPYSDIDGNNAGRAYIFERPAGGWQSASLHNETKILTASDAGADKTFGFSVSIDRDDIIVGSPGAGKGYFFSRNQGGSNNWGQVFTSYNQNGSGRAVCIKNEEAIISHYPQSGSVREGGFFVYKKENGTWTYKQGDNSNYYCNGSTLGLFNDDFGKEVSCWNSEFIVSAPDMNITTGDCPPNLPDWGVGAGWTRHYYPYESQGQILYSNDFILPILSSSYYRLYSNDHFGSSVDMDGSHIINGIPYRNAEADDDGEIYIYNYRPGIFPNPCEDVIDETNTTLLALDYGTIKAGSISLGGGGYNFIVGSSTTVTYESAEVTLKPGFNAQPGSGFTATSMDCTAPFFIEMSSAELHDDNTIKELTVNDTPDDAVVTTDGEYVLRYYNENYIYLWIKFSDENSNEVQITVYNAEGKSMYKEKAADKTVFKIPIHEYPGGMYKIEATRSGKSFINYFRQIEKPTTDEEE